MEQCLVRIISLFLFSPAIGAGVGRLSQYYCPVSRPKKSKNHTDGQVHTTENRFEKKENKRKDGKGGVSNVPLLPSAACTPRPPIYTRCNECTNRLGTAVRNLRGKSTATLYEYHRVRRTQPRTNKTLSTMVSVHQKCDTLKEGAGGAS